MLDGERPQLLVPDAEVMLRTAVTVVVTAAVTLAAVHLSGGFEKPSAPAPQELLLERMSRLEIAITRLADAKTPELMLSASSAPSPPAATAAITLEKEKRRESALRAGNAVIEQIVNAGRFSIEDDVALTAAITELSGEDQVAVMSRLSMAINDGRVQLRLPGE